MGNKKSREAQTEGGGAGHTEQQTPKCGCCDMKLRRQTNCMWTAFIFLYCSAYHLGFSFVNPRALDLEWARTATDTQALFTLLVFHFGVMAASVVTPFMLHKVPKKFIYLFAGVFYLSGGVVMTGFSYAYYNVLISRLLIGFGHGIVQITSLVHGSEVAEKNRRGYLITEIHVNQMMSIFTAKYLLTDIPSFITINSTTLIGVLTLVMTTIGLVLLPVLVEESPVYFLKKGQNGNAVDILVHLRREKDHNPDIQEEFYELKKMVEEDHVRSPSKSIFVDGNSKPLFFALLAGLVFTLLYNYPINTIRFMRIRAIYEIPLSSGIFTIIRAVFMIIYMSTFDRFERRTILAFSGGCMAISILTLAIVCAAITDAPLWFGIVFYIFFEAIGTNGIFAVSAVLLAEIFPTTKKIYSIAFLQILESVTHIILTSWTFDAALTNTFVNSYLFICGGTVLVIVIFLFLVLPPTANKSLREARSKFWRNYSIPPGHSD